MNKLLVPIIIIAILIIVYLMWNSGMFGGATDAERAAVPAGTSSSEATTGNGGNQAVGNVEQNAPKVEPAQAVAMPSDDEIIAAADALLANHKPDFAGCLAEADKIKALECAAAGQTSALAAAFEEHNQLRAEGDRVSAERGGEVMRRVVAALQEQLDPFVAAADGS